MTAAELALTRKIDALPIGQIKALARDTYQRACNGDLDAEIVNDFCLARLGGLMTSADFVAFCESL
jgi:hypothetical protein